MWCDINIFVITKTREFWIKLGEGETVHFSKFQGLSCSCPSNVCCNYWTSFPCTPQIPNPLFDLAGITCGHFLVPFWTFFGATLIGKAVIKMHIQASAAPSSGLAGGEAFDSFPACSTVLLGNESWSLLARPEVMEINLVWGIYNKGAAGLLQTEASE